MIEVTPTSPAGLMGGFNKKQWFLLPMKLRQRWWSETDYGKNPPSEELKSEIQKAIKEKTDADSESSGLRR